MAKKSAQTTSPPFTTISGRSIEPLYRPPDPPQWRYERDLADPGCYPFTRGIHESMYRGKLWTMRQFAGYGSATQTNARFKYLLEHGSDGLSVAFDLPTLMGRDPDHPLSLGEVGKCGVAVTSLADMETLFDGIPLGQVSTSMTINSPAAMLLAFYILVGERQGVPQAELSGTLQADILKEFIAQKEYIYPPRPSMRIIVDMIRYCTEHMPKWNTISISGYHIREAGATAAQELAFTLRDGIEYVQWCVDAGLDVDDFAPRLSFFFNSHSDFFEEIAKFRAARRIWARTMKERFGAKNPRSWTCRFHAQTAGVSLTAQQPYNNVVRTALQALAAVLGGTQSLHTNSLDEALALPTEEAVTIALRTQQVIAHESGVDQHRRSAGRLVFRRDADERDRGRGPGILPSDRRSRRHGVGHRARLPAARDPGGRLPVPAGGGAQGEDRRRRERVRHGGEGASDPLHRRRRGRGAGRRRARAPGNPR